MVALVGGTVGISAAATNGVLATAAATGMISGASIGLLNTAVMKGTAADSSHYISSHRGRCQCYFWFNCRHQSWRSG